MRALAIRRQAVGVKYPMRPVPSPREEKWADQAFGPQRRCAVPSREEGLVLDMNVRAPWDVAFRDPGPSGTSFVPGSLGTCISFWDEVILSRHPQSIRLLSWLKWGVSLHEFLRDEIKGGSRECPFQNSRFTGEVNMNRVLVSFQKFVDDEICILAHRGGVVKWEHVRSSQGPKTAKVNTGA